MKSIIAGEQTQTVFKDTRELAKAAQMADAVIKGSKVEVNDEKTYNNGVKVASILLAGAGIGRCGELREGAR